MSNEQQQHEELLIAYLDGELGADERSQAESLMRENSRYAELVANWKSNQVQLRQLTTRKLDDQFANRVLAKIESDKLTAALPVATEPAMGSFIALASLAALLFLTVFVFPSFVDSEPVVADSAVANTNEVVTPDPGSELLHSSTGNRNDTNIAPVTAPVKSGLRKLLWLEVETTRKLGDIEQVFADNKIRIQGGADQRVGMSHFESQGGVDAVYVVANPSQMNQAVRDLGADESVSIRAFPLPKNDAAQTLNRSLNGSAASAQQLIPIELSNAGGRPDGLSPEEMKEVEMIDRWFGISDEEEDALVEYLLIIDVAKD